MLGVLILNPESLVAVGTSPWAGRRAEADAATPVPYSLHSSVLDCAASDVLSLCARAAPFRHRPLCLWVWDTCAATPRGGQSNEQGRDGV